MGRSESSLAIAPARADRDGAEVGRDCVELWDLGANEPEFEDGNSDLGKEGLIRVVVFWSAMSATYSICATHYNNAEYIRESAGVVAGAIADRPEWEFVVVDAGSDDGSLSYLHGLADASPNVTVVVENGANIGRGRQVAAEAAEGEFLLQLSDLDAVFYDDGRLFDIMDYYVGLVDAEGDLQLNTIGAFIVTKRLLERVGGWNALPVAEERDLNRRMLREGALRFCDVKLFQRNMGADKEFFDAVTRFFLNTRAKFDMGVSFWYMLFVWMTRAPGLKPRLGAPLVFPLAYLSHLTTGTQLTSYDAFDDYVLDFRRSVKRDHPELWLDPPEELRYAAV